MPDHPAVDATLAERLRAKIEAAVCAKQNGIYEIECTLELIAVARAAADALDAARTPGLANWTSVAFNGEVVAYFKHGDHAHDMAHELWPEGGFRLALVPAPAPQAATAAPPEPAQQSKGGPVIHGVEMHVGHGGFASANEEADWESVTAAWPEPVDESPDGGRFLWARRKRGSGSLDILYQVGEHLWSLRWHGPARREDFDVLGSVAPPQINQEGTCKSY